MYSDVFGTIDSDPIIVNYGSIILFDKLDHFLRTGKL